MRDTLQRFGLAYCDLPTMMWNVEVMLRVVAVKIDKGAKSIPKFFYVLTAVSIVTYFFNYYASMLCFVIVDCQETGDFLLGLMVFSTSITSMIGVTKLIYIYINQNKVQSLVAGYIAYDRFPLSPSTAGLMAVIMRDVKKRLIMFWAVTMGNGLIYISQPLVGFILPTGLKLYDKHVVFGLKFILGITNYPIAIVNIITCTTFICYVVSNITGLFIVTTGYSEGRLLALSQELRELWADAQRHYRENFDVTYADNKFDKEATEEINKYVQHRLHLIVQSHAINIALLRKIEDIFRNAIAAEFILLTAGLIADLLGGLEDTYIILPFSLMQVSMDCYMGQKIKDASIIFENAAYDCMWENFDIRNRKTVFLILKMSQRTPTLSAGGVATLSFESLMAMYKAVYSAYTTLRSTVGK